MDNKKVVYLGLNSFRIHKRGVENVIEFQSLAVEDWCYYIHWGDSLKVYKCGNLVCISLPVHSVWKFVLLSILIKRISLKYNGKIFIHSHNTLMSIFLYRHTDLFTVHDGLYYQKCASGVKVWKKRIFYILEKILYMRCKHIHFISHFTKSKSLYSLSATNFTLIYNTSNFELKALNFVPKQSMLYMEYPFLEGKQFCLAVRSLEERARIDLMIDLAAKRKDIYFIIAGKGPLFAQLQHKIDIMKLANIRLLGFVPDELLFQLYAFSDFVIVPAEYGEGFGLPIIEAYLFNKPVIASRCCAIPEVIIDDKYLFENNVDSILDCMNYCNQCNRNDFFNYYQEHFSQKIIIGQYKQLYRKCI